MRFTSVLQCFEVKFATWNFHRLLLRTFGNFWLSPHLFLKKNPKIRPPSVWLGGGRVGSTSTNPKMRQTNIANAFLFLQICSWSIILSTLLPSIEDLWIWKNYAIIYLQQTNQLRFSKHVNTNQGKNYGIVSFLHHIAI